MLKKILIVILLALFLYSCSSYKSMVSANDNVKQVELKMSKEKVISIMGKNTYRMSGLSVNENGARVEQIWYPATQSSIFFFTFEDNQLVEWHEKFILSDSEKITE